jgi:hypothetical protein
MYRAFQTPSPSRCHPESRVLVLRHHRFTLLALDLIRDK